MSLHFNIFYFKPISLLFRLFMTFLKEKQKK